MRSFLLPALIVVSVAAHVAASALLDARLVPPHRAPATVEITTTPRRPPPPPPAPAPAPAPAARTAPHVPRPASRAPAPRPRPPSPVPPPPAAPADFTGVTLTNDTAGAWVTATGDGTTLAGPVATPTERPQAPRAAAPGPAGPPVVALGDLSRAPKAPDLDDALRQNYPAEASQRGLAGKAVVRTRIGADGQARVLAIVRESAAGFGEACRRTVAGSRWEPPLDRDGTPVATEISYTCRFEVGR